MDTKKRKQAIYRITLVGAVVNLLLVAFKFVAGWLGHSGAMIADAVHSLSDLVTDAVVLYFVHVAGKPRDRDHEYGHGKYETFATMTIGFLLLLVGAGLFWGGVSTIADIFRGRVLPSPGYVALVAALVSLLGKELVFHYTMRAGRRLRSDALKANAWHHRSDALSSLGTALGIAGAIFLGEKARILDPLAAVVVSLLIVRVAVRLVVPGFNELMESSLPEDVESDILRTAASCPGVGDPHSLRTRCIGGAYAIELHVRMDGKLSLEEAHARATQVERLLRARYGEATHVVVHVEPYK